MAGFSWIRPEVYPLFAAVGAGLGLCVFQLGRNLYTNPDVRLNRENRCKGVWDNYEEGFNYKENFLRRYVRDRAPEIMPSVNKFFSKPSE